MHTDTAINTALPAQNEHIPTAFKVFVGFVAVTALAMGVISVLAQYGFDVRVNNLMGAYIIGGVGVVLLIGLAINACLNRNNKSLTHTNSVASENCQPRIITIDGSEFATITPL